MNVPRVRRLPYRPIRRPETIATAVPNAAKPWVELITDVFANIKHQSFPKP